MPVLAPTDSYEHVQSSPSATWVVTHNLNRLPIIDVYVDSEGQKTRILPQITHTNANSCTIVFSEPQTGFAALI